jgi:hypothetical protein
MASKSDAEYRVRQNASARVPGITVKIARLKRQADAAEADAKVKRVEFKTHSERSLAIVRRRVGSPAGLAISFSLGFMAGTRGGERKSDGQAAGNGEHTEDDKGVAYKLVHGPLGDTAINLGTALFVRSLMNFLDERAEDGADPSDPASTSSEAPLA